MTRRDLGAQAAPWDETAHVGVRNVCVLARRRAPIDALLAAFLAPWMAACAPAAAPSSASPSASAAPAPPSLPPATASGPAPAASAPPPEETPDDPVFKGHPGRLTPPSGIEASAVAVGKPAPPIELPTAAGAPFSLTAALARGPAVVVFYRGFW